MSLQTDTNTIRFEVIDDSTGRVKARVEWLDVNYEYTVEIERAVLLSTINLGDQVVAANAGKTVVQA